jgi:hypothetical protein
VSKKVHNMDETGVMLSKREILEHCFINDKSSYSKVVVNVPL